MGSRRLGRKRIFALNKRGQSDTVTAGATAPSVTRQTTRREGNKIITEISVDLGGNTSVSSAGVRDVIGQTDGATSTIATLDLATHGYITYAELACVETIAGGGPDIDLELGSAATDAEDTTVTNGNVLVESNGNHAPGSRVGAIVAIHDWDSESDKYLYLTVGAAAAGTYTAGKLLVTLEGIASDAVPDA